MTPVFNHAKLLDPISRVVIVALAFSDVFHPTQAFSCLNSRKRIVSPPLRPVVPSTVGHERGSSIVLTSALDVPEEANQDSDLGVESNTCLTETKWSQIESLQVETLQSEKVPLGDVIISSSGDSGRCAVVLSCLSHYGDFNAWEMTQQYMSAIKSGRLSDNWYEKNGF
jgi:hypothetical protein